MWCVYGDDVCGACGDDVCGVCVEMEMTCVVCVCMEMMMLMLMFDTVKIRGPTMLRRRSRTASSAKRKTHSCTGVAATQVAEGWTKTQRLKGCPFLAWLTTSRKYTRARVQMRQKSKSLAAKKVSLHHDGSVHVMVT